MVDDMSWQERLRRLDVDLAAGKLSGRQYAIIRDSLLAEAAEIAALNAELRRPARARAKARPAGGARALLHTDRPTTAPSPADQEPTESIPACDLTLPMTPVEPPTVIIPRPPAAEPPARSSLPLVALTVIALLLIGAGVWLLASPSDTGSPEAATRQSAPAEPTPTTLADRLPPLPGVIDDRSGVHEIDAALKRDLIGRDDAAVLKKHHARDLWWHGSIRRGTSYVLLVAENDTADDARAIAKALQAAAREQTPKIDSIGDPKLPTFAKYGKKSGLYRVIYPSGRYTVRISVVQAPPDDKRSMRARLAVVADDVSAVLPPR